MKIKISRNMLLPALQASNNVVERRQALPILSNLLIQIENNNIKLTATDLEVELRSICVAEEATNGDIALSARKLFDICRALPSESEITIENAGTKTNVTSGRSRFSLSTMKAEYFPSIGSFEALATFEIDRDIFSDLLESTLFAMAHQDVRYYLNGLLLELEAKQIRAVATDGHRLAVSEIPLTLAVEKPTQIIIPRKGVMEIVRLLSGAPDKIKVNVGENHLSVDGGSQTLTTKLVEGVFPDYNRVIPRDSQCTIVADRETLRAGLGRASILSNEKFRGVRLILSGDLLKAIAHNPEQEEAEEEIEIQYDGPKLEVGFNVSYLLDVLGTMTSDSIKIELKDANSSCLIYSEENDSTRYVVMPMRL